LLQKDDLTVTITKTLLNLGHHDLFSLKLYPDLQMHI